MNDNSSGQTSAWICPSACNAGTIGGGGIADVHVVDSNHNALDAQPAPYSLTELGLLLPHPSPPPTPTPTPTKAPACSPTTETDNTAVGADYIDNRGNTWDVYYDLKRDSTTGLPCQMRVVVRIFNPAPNGSWHGTAAVYANKDGSYLSASFGKITSSGTYQAHFVWRGPWFTASSGNYTIVDIEYNGSNSYQRAYGIFRI